MQDKEERKIVTQKIRFKVKEEKRPMVPSINDPRPNNTYPKDKK